MTLLDLEAHVRGMIGGERLYALEAARRREAEARQLREELLARGEVKVAAMLTHALKQLSLAGAS
jgi:hypothetical protein